LPHKISLRFFYKIVDQIFVHTPQMKRELVEQFDIAESKVTVVPFGINEVIRSALVSQSEARQQLGLNLNDKTLLFFGNIAPYKGVEDLLRALARLVSEEGPFTLLLAGRVKDRGCEAYWLRLENLIEELRLAKYIRKEIRYVPDTEVGLLFRASDVSVLPYRRVYQSGVVALSYAQGVPVIASDVGSLKTDIVEGQTGLVFRSGDVPDLANKIRAYFASDLFKNLEAKRRRIRAYGAEKFSWARNGELTAAVYERLLGK
jgi:D-inositol-3-phosphate glycosyltransferase